MQQRPVESAQGVPLEELADAFTRGYEKYIVPVQMNAEALQRFITQNDIRVDASRLIRGEDGQIIGLGMLGVRGHQAWVGGIGIALAHRRQGIGRTLMQALIQSARDVGITDLYLEVITTNTAAHTLYEQLGFKMQRRLLIVNAANMTPVSVSPQVQPIDPVEALQHFDALHPRPNNWQRQPQGLAQVAATAEALALYDGADLRGYVLYRKLPNGGHLWLDFGVQTGDAEAMQQLASAARQPDAPTTMVNLGEDEFAWEILDKMGCHVDLMQFEMLFNVT